ncbi:hypothetical protein [Actinoallomurus oryzae]
MSTTLRARRVSANGVRVSANGVHPRVEAGKLHPRADPCGPGDS